MHHVRAMAAEASVSVATTDPTRLWSAAARGTAAMAAEDGVLDGDIGRHEHGGHGGFQIEKSIVN